MIAHSNRARFTHSPYFALGITIATFLFLLLAASLRYTGFFSAGVFLNLLGDNAFLGPPRSA